jgi:CRISPR-associated protein Csx17
MTLHIHNLKGCSPAPLANYLKALGILRLVGEQADKQVRGWWQDECFCLLTTLSREELKRFFLESYEPTPLLSPWNKGCGFFKANDPGLMPLENSRAPRFARFRRGVAESRRLLAAISQVDATIRAIKARTKTNKTFQSEDQRQLLHRSDAFRVCIEELRRQLSQPNVPSDRWTEIQEEISTIESLVTTAHRHPLKSEADRLKASAGYKRLLAVADRRFDSLKAGLIPDCQRAWRGPHAEWLSAAVVLDERGDPQWPSLLGTGGNDGNLDFTNNFMQQLGAIFDLATETGDPRREAKELLENSLWAEAANKLATGAIGQYQPGAAGGANSSTGFDGGNLVNAWDFVLMMEGSLLFSSRATKRLDPNAGSRASAPFAVRSDGAGFATPGSEKAQRGEQWMPLWKQAATLRDVAALYGEARVQIKRQTATRPLDMARAISRLGVARGIEAFMRYGYFERNGQSTLAVPLGRVSVRCHPRAYLLDDLPGWLERLRRRSQDKHAPARLIQAQRSLADAVFAALTHDDSPDRWQAILRAAVNVEATQATGTAIDAGPIPPLRPEWASAVDDGSPEVRLALALGGAAASYTREGRPVDPVRYHWLPLEEPGARHFMIADKRLVPDGRVVMSGRDAVSDFSAVVERRLIEAAAKGQRRSCLTAAGGCSARLNDLARFLQGSIDLNKLLGLACAFMAIQWERWSRDHWPHSSASSELPEEAWLSIRLGCLPWPLTDNIDIPADPRIIRRLMAGDSTRATDVALARLRAVGIRPPLQTAITDVFTARRWAASLVFPINRGDAWRAAVTLDPSLKGPFHV